MWPNGVVFFQPSLSDFPDFGQAAEQIKAEHFLAVGAIETLDNGIVTNGKFCLNREVGLKLSWSRQPKDESNRLTISAALSPQTQNERGEYDGEQQTELAGTASASPKEEQPQAVGSSLPTHSTNGSKSGSRSRAGSYQKGGAQ